MEKDIDFPENTGIIIEAPTFLAHLNAYQNLKNLADIRGIIGPDEISQSISAVGLDPNSNKKKLESFLLECVKSLELLKQLWKILIF